MDLLPWVCKGSWKIPPKRLHPRVIDDLSDVVEERILEKIKEKFRSEMALLKSDMIAKIISTIGGVPWHVGSKEGYEEVAEDFEVSRLRGEEKTDHVERPMGNRDDEFYRPRSQLRLKHKMEVSNFSSTLNL